MKKSFIYSVIASVLLLSCSDKSNYDASGTFETVETIVSSEVEGTIKELKLEEGETLKAGAVVAKIDTIQLVLKKQQLLAQINAIANKQMNVGTQTAFFDQQKAVAETNLQYLLNEQKRTKNLIAADAATSKQLDDINNKIAETRKQINVITEQKLAQISVLQTQNKATSSEESVVRAQIAQVEDMISKSTIINPIAGVVLTKYVEDDEVVSKGKPLYKIANLSSLILRAYITGDQFEQVKIGQKVKVTIGSGDFSKEYPGTIEWISSKAEFTPKTIQTKDERANLVYAIKIKVPNDGKLKIGMYADVNF